VAGVITKFGSLVLQSVAGIIKCGTTSLS